MGVHDPGAVLNRIIQIEPESKSLQRDVGVPIAVLSFKFGLMMLQPVHFHLGRQR